METGATSTISPAWLHKTQQVKNLSSTAQTNISRELLSVTQEFVRVRRNLGETPQLPTGREFVADSRRFGMFATPEQLTQLRTYPSRDCQS